MVNKLKSKSLLMVAAVAALAVLGWVAYKQMRNDTVNKIDTFKECAADVYARGGALEGSNPPRCVAPDGTEYIGEPIAPRK